MIVNRNGIIPIHQDILFTYVTSELNDKKYKKKTLRNVTSFSYLYLQTSEISEIVV